MKREDKMSLNTKKKEKMHFFEGYKNEIARGGH